MPARANVIEVFNSIQGEGKYAGVQQVFVRMAGCNLNCSYCDSSHARDVRTSGAVEMDPLQVWTQIEQLWGGSHSVCFTGGEPLMQVAFLKEMFTILRVYKVLVYLDTNGTLSEAFKEVADDVDILSMDIKLPSSTGCPGYWDEHLEFLRLAWGREIFIKTVITKDTVMDDMIKAVEIIAKGDPAMPLFLQPNFADIEGGVIIKCREYQKYAMNYLSDVRIIPQLHKLMKIR
jgi:organic radical activating enzyme